MLNRFRCFGKLPTDGNIQEFLPLPAVSLRVARYSPRFAHACRLDHRILHPRERARQIHSHGAEHGALLFAYWCRSDPATNNTSSAPRRVAALRNRIGSPLRKAGGVAWWN